MKVVENLFPPGAGRLENAARSMAALGFITIVLGVGQGVRHLISADHAENKAFSAESYQQSANYFNKDVKESGAAAKWFIIGGIGGAFALIGAFGSYTLGDRRRERVEDYNLARTHHILHTRKFQGSEAAAEYAEANPPQKR